MKPLHLLSTSAALSALLLVAAALTSAQQRPIGVNGITPIVNGGEFGWKNLPRRFDNGGRFDHGGRFGRGRFHGGGFGFGGGTIYVEREVPVYIEREVVREVPVEVPVEPEKPREPYVIGKSYASLPGSCMKMIEDGASYYYCDGEWYQETGWGRDAKYKAVKRKL